MTYLKVNLTHPCLLLRFNSWRKSFKIFYKDCSGYHRQVQREGLACSAVYKEMKKTWYHDMLRDDIMEFVSILSCKTLEEMIDRDRDREIKLELRNKRKPTQV